MCRVCFLVLYWWAGVVLTEVALRGQEGVINISVIITSRSNAVPGAALHDGGGGGRGHVRSHRGAAF